MTMYTVTAERSGKWWVLQCVEVPGAISQVARLDQADQIKEAIAFVAGVPEADVEITVKPVLPELARKHIERARRLRVQAVRANSESAEETRIAAKVLHEDLALTLRDVGVVMEVSYQRAHQLVKS